MCYLCSMLSDLPPTPVACVGPSDGAQDLAAPAPANDPFDALHNPPTQDEINTLVDNLATARWNAGGILGAAEYVTYSFATNVASYDTAADRPGFVATNAAQQAAFRTALSKWSAISGIVFLEVPDSDATQIRFGLHNFNGTSDAGFAGYAYLPSMSSDKTFTKLSGDVWINTANVVAGDPNLTAVTSQHVIMHEIGHAIGFKHPFDDTPTLPAADDNTTNTIMSYTGFAQSSPRVLDIAAARYFYGQLPETYSWNAATLTLSITGDGAAESLNGSEAKDVIFASGGGDLVHGLSGADALIGGDGDDTLYGDGGDDILYGGAGVDYLLGGAGADYLQGDDGAFSTLDGGDGNDSVYGGAGNDYMIGGAGDDVMVGLGGQDSLYGGAGNDYLVAGAGPGAVVDGGAGANSLWGASGNDYIVGGEGADLAVGGAGSDYLFGNAGADTLYGGQGTDYIYTNAGNDFVWTDDVGAAQATDYIYVGGGTGTDTIADFTPGSGATHDVLVVSLGSGVTTFAQAMANTIQVGVYSVLTLGADQVYLYNVQPFQLVAADFLFL